VPAFQYTPLDAKGRQRKGLIEADTPRMARQVLRERGSEPAGRRRSGQSGAAAVGRQLWGLRISATDLALITRQLATLVASGLPLEEA
jgi:general secretion pathway protein F